MSDCIIGIPSFGQVSINWAMSLTSIAMPINFSNQFHLVMNKRIDIARNEIVAEAIKREDNPRFVFFLDDDVIMPPDTLRKLVHKMDNLPEDIGAISGVYYSKSEPGEPLIFQKKGRGSYYDWKVGDFFKAWAAGCGLVIIRTQALRDMQAQVGEPFFAIDYGLTKKGDGTYEARSITEDLYFYTKMGKTKAPNGKNYSLWIDTSIQGLHFEKNSKKFFGLQPEEPQAQGRAPLKLKYRPDLLWVGYGGRKDELFGCNKTTVDELKEFNPDIVSRGDHLPLNDNAFDILYSAHLLHTFSIDDVPRVLAEWKRVLKPGGKIWIKVPDIDHAIEKSTEDPKLAEELLYRGRSGFNKALATKAFSEAGFVDIYIFTNGAELTILGRKGE